MTHDSRPLLSKSEDRLVSFRDNGSDFRWIDVVTFTTHDHVEDRHLLAELIRSPWYSHTYAEVRGPEPRPGSVHGPYRLDVITLASFEHRERAVLDERIWQWALSEAVPMSPVLHAKLTDELAWIRDGDPSVWELPDLGPEARHEWGDVVGLSGFLEFVAISRRRAELTLVVASDD